MNSLMIALGSAGCIFAGSLLGMQLSRRLPDRHLSKEMQDVVKLSAGMVATLTALVLGLLVSSAKSSFDSLNSSIVQASAKLVLMDRALARYGPEAKAVRDGVRNAITVGFTRVWSAKENQTSGLAAFEEGKGMALLEDQIALLKPQTDAQRQIVAQVQQFVADLQQARWLAVEQAQNELPMPLLGILVFWLVLLFMSFGMFAPRNTMAVVVLAIGACAVSASIFLVLELNQPLDGFIKLSSAPLKNALHHIGE